MVSEKRYKLAKHIYYVCILLLIPSAVLFGCLLYDCLVHDADTGNLLLAVIDIALFSVLLIRNRRIKNSYEKQTPTDGNEHVVL